VYVGGAHRYLLICVARNPQLGLRIGDATKRTLVDIATYGEPPTNGKPIARDASAQFRYKWGQIGCLTWETSALSGSIIALGRPAFWRSSAVPLACH